MYRGSLLLLLFVFILLFTSSCSGEKEVNIITLNNNTLILEGAGGKDVIVFTSSAGKWAASSSEEWCEISPLIGEAKMGTITVNAEANLTFAERQAKVNISAPDAVDVEVLVTQGIPEGLDLLLLNETEITVEPDESIVTLLLNSTSNNWSVSKKPNWVTISPESGTTGEYSLTITFSENTGINRLASILFSGNGAADVTLVVNQKRAAYPSYSIPIAADKTGVEKNAIQLASSIQLGWNLGNTMEVPGDETGWGNPKTTKEIIDMVKAAGFDAVRIPCAWNSYIENSVTCKLKESWINRVKEVVGYCIDNDMYAIINIHWDGGWLEENPVYAKQEAVNAKQTALWEQIAMAFRDYDEHLLFAGTNEVHAGYGTPSAENLKVQMSFNQTFVDAVRSTGGKNAYRNLIVQAYNTNIDLAYNELKMPTDQVKSRLFAEVHYYDPWDFCGANSNDGAKFYWGKEGGYTEGISSYGQEDHVRAQFAKMKSKFVDKGIPVIMGEYGAVNRTAALASEAEKLKHQESRKYFLKYTTQIMRENGILPFYWDNGHIGKDGFGLFNRKTKTVFDQAAIDGLNEAVEASVYPF